MSNIVINKTDALIKSGLEIAIDRQEEINKFAGLQASASEIDALVGTKVHSVLRNNGLVVSIGDSTHDVHDYFKVLTKYLSKIGVSTFQNAASGQSGKDWKNNADQTTLQQCIDACIGVDGEDTICLFSHGINDYKVIDGVMSTEADVKGWLIEGLNLLKVAKPKVNIVLVSPVFTGNEERNTILKRIYEEISTELSLPLIDSSISTGNIHGTPFFYADATHPNIYGHERRIIYMFQQLLPVDLYKYIELEEFNMPTPPTSLELFDGETESGFYSTGSGEPVVSADWLRVKNRIAVEPNFILNVEHYGNRVDVLFYDQDDNFISYLNLATVIGETYKQVTIPPDGWFLRLNITSDISTYTNTFISVKYYIAAVLDPITLDKVLDGLSISFPRPIKPMITNLSINDKSISIDKIDFITVGKNLFDKNNHTVDSYMQDGIIKSSTLYSFNHIPIEVVAETEYYITGRIRMADYYDADMNLVFHDINVKQDTSIIIPDGASKMIPTVYQTDDLSLVQIEEGNATTSYEAFGYYITLPNGIKVKLG